MMARLTYSGAEELADKLLTLGEKGKDISKMALYDGAGVVADAVRAGVATIPTLTTRPFDGLTESDREDLAAGIGIAKFQEGSDEVTTAVSFNGYARRKEKNFPNGVPLALLARSLESGSSLRQKHPFVRIAVSGAKAAAIAAMSERVNEEIKKVME